jgi:hypothetical protein
LSHTDALRILLSVEDELKALTLRTHRERAMFLHHQGTTTIALAERTQRMAKINSLAPVTVFT